MSKMANSIMKDLLQLSLKEDVEEFARLDKNSIIYHSLSNEKIEELARKISSLPAEYRNILFFRYCFDNSPCETNNILGIENSVAKLSYIQRNLSNLMGFDDLWIDNNSLEKACHIALIEETKEYDNIKILHKPNYSKDFRKKLKSIKINQNHNGIFISLAKRVAIFILVSILSFSAILTVNAEAREKVFTWIVERFEEYSIFSRNINRDSETTDLASFKINYIPIGFELNKIHQGHNMLIYVYSNEDNQELTIKLFQANGNSKSYYDTENAEIEEFTFGDSKAFTWKTDTNTYFISEYSGIEYHISGQLDRQEILTIAENISK